MTKQQESPSYKKFLMYLTAVVILLLGITLILVWWESVVNLFRGFLGLAFALSGLIMLYILNTRK